MRKVNLITWDLVKKELNLSDVNKGEKINIIYYTGVIKKDMSFEDNGIVKTITIKAR